MTSHNLRRLAAAAATFSLSFTASAAINSAAIVSSTLSLSASNTRSSGSATGCSAARMAAR